MKALVPYTVTTAMLTAASVTEADHAEWAAGTAYSAGDRCIRVITHRIYERLIAGTTTAGPEADEVNWVEVGPTNRWAMFDGAVGTSTTSTTSLSVTLAMPGPVGDVVLLGVVGTSVAVYVNGTLTRTTAVPVADVTGVGSTMVITGLGIGGAHSLQVIVTGSGTVAVGTLAVGTFTTVGLPEKGMQIGTQDFSTKTFDAYGTATIVRRGHSRKLSFPFTTTPASLDQCARVLAALRSRPVVWMGLTWIDATVVFGYASEWTLTLERGIVRGSLSIRSLAFGL